MNRTWLEIRTPNLQDGHFYLGADSLTFSSVVPKLFFRRPFTRVLLLLLQNAFGSGSPVKNSSQVLNLPYLSDEWSGNQDEKSELKKA